MFGVYRVVTWLYMALPAFAGALAIVRCRRRRSFEPLRGFALTGLVGIAMGLTVSVLYALGLHARIPPGQLIITCYWAFSVACLLVTFNRVLMVTLGWLYGTRLGSQTARPGAEIGASLTRAILLLVVGVPYVLSMVLVYRPKIVRAGDPQSVLHAAYETISFRATDGTPLQGWWIPSAKTDRTDVRHNAQAWGERTVILCHGFGADKASDLRLVRDLVPNGYNVLAFDFRAHGQSGGQLTTFGNLERKDVLGAVRWVKANHADQAQRIYGLGESMGAAALIGAAGDSSPEGQAIDAMAVYAPFDKLTTLFKGVADVHFAPAAGWLAANVALPVAGLQMGSNFKDFSPARAVQGFWPRPILVLASDEDRGVDARRCHAVFDNALQPKYHYWIEKGSRDTILFVDDEASFTVRVFFEGARSIL